MKCLNILYRSSEDLDVLLQMVANVPRDQILIQVYAGGCGRDSLKSLQSVLMDAFPGVAILGATTEGEILGTTISQDTIVLSLSVFDDTKVKTLYADDSHPDGLYTFARDIHAESAKAAILFRCGAKDGHLQRSLDYIQAIGAENPGLVLAGGQAGVGAQYKDTFVFTEHFLSNRGAVVATLKGPNLHAESLRIDGWEQIGREMQITRAVGERVYEIDERSVIDTYKHYLGVDIDLVKLQNPTLEFPLTCVRDGILMKNVPITYHPDGAVEFLFPFRVDEKIKFSFCDISRLHQDLKQMQSRVATLKPDGIFFFSCSGRKMILGNKISGETHGFSHLCDSAGFFTSSEFYSGGGHCSVSLIQNMTMLVLSEGSKREKPVQWGAPIPQHSEEELRSIKMLKILTNLISATSRELEESNRALYEMAVLDSMTGLLNRRSFDVMMKSELKRHVRSLQPMSLLLIDIDYFKQYNDHYGHVAGDDCLEKVGAVVRETLLRASDMAFRYGGEEMCCLLPATDFAAASHLADRLQQNVREAGIDHEQSSISSLLTVSIGFMTYHFAGKSQPDEDTIIKACDKMLYAAKQGGRNKSVGGELTL